MRRLGPLVAILLMMLFGFGVYFSLGSTRSAIVNHPASPPPPPVSAKPAFTLPGTIYVIQSGALYSFRGGSFTQLGQPGGWAQPAASPDGSHLVAVKRAFNVSDLYQIGLDGSVQKQLTRNSARIVEVNQWAFYPRYSPDGSQLYFSTDRPKDYSYRVDLAVWSMPAAGGASKQWTRPDFYSGGDVQPVPLSSGGLVYTKYTIDDANESVPQVMLAARALDKGVALTQASDHCAQPALSADGTELAMICSTGPRTAQLVVSSFDGHRVGARDVYVDGTLAASPAWAPDGSGLVYFAPGVDDPGGGFQLWWVGVNVPPKQLTTGLSFDALSPPVWLR
jgi:Tol biopolymer transport system component